MKLIIYNLFKKLNLVYQTRLKNYNHKHNHKHHNKHNHNHEYKSFRILKKLNGVYNLHSNNNNKNDSFISQYY